MSLKSKIRLGSGAHKFEEIVKMIEEMVILLGKQQDEDDKQKEWCRGEFDKAEDEEAAAKTKLEQVTAAVSEQQDTITALMEEISILKKKITDLDFAVAEATEQRKE